MPAFTAHFGNISFVLPNDIKSEETLSVDFAFPLGGNCLMASLLNGIEISILVFCCTILRVYVPALSFFKSPHVKAATSQCRIPQKQQNEESSLYSNVAEIRFY